MLTKLQIERYSEVLLWGLKTARKNRYKKGDIVALRYDLSASRLAETIQVRLIESGFNLVMRPGLTPLMEQNFYGKTDIRQLRFVAPGERELHENLNGSIFLFAPDSLTHLSGIDPTRIGKAAVSRKCLRDILQRREDEGSFGWTLCAMPTAELAKQAHLTERQYSNQIVKACYLDMDDPVKAWKEIFRSAKAIKKRLNSMAVEYYHIESNNIDLKVSPGKQRNWIGISGHNIPSFEIFLSPDWRGTDGVYYANQPSFRSGNYVEEVRLIFKKGSVTGIEAKRGKEFVEKQLSMDKGARRLGEFSLTDKRFSRINRFMANTLYDENYGGRYGNCHIALGASYSDTYEGDPAGLTEKEKERLGFNDSALHWDLVNTENKRVTAHLKGGEKAVIYEKGLFVLK